MIIIGLSPTVHESAAGVIVDGRLVAAASEERFTRVKSQGGFPHQALAFVMKEAGVTSREVDYVAYAALPYAQERSLDLQAYFSNVGYIARCGGNIKHRALHFLNYSRNILFNMEWQSWGGTVRLMVKELAKYGLADKLTYVDHHLSHVASAYYSSGFDRALAVSLDGYGSGASGSFYLAESGKLTLLTKIPYPHSLGMFYRRVTQGLGFKPNRHEGKIVGLAAYGDPQKLYGAVMSRFDVSQEDHYRFKDGQNSLFEREIIEKYSREDIAGAYQKVLEDVIQQYIGIYVRKYGLKNVVAAGGVFANVKANQRVAEIPEVDYLFIFPAMGDGGVGVGAALAVAAELEGLKPKRLPNMYLGPGFSEKEIEEAIRVAGLDFQYFAEIEQEVASLVAQGRVVARFDGKMEFGPRALGNRSILSQATDASVNKWLNDRLKRTEFMPFAPATLAEHVDYLYNNFEKGRYTAEFMTMTFNCTPKMQRQSPAAVHVDGTARPQLVSEKTSRSFHRILRYYHQLTGLPSMINTSFNMHEEPIVCTPQDAVRGFLEGRLDYLAAGPFLIAGNGQVKKHDKSSSSAASFLL